AVGLEIAVAAQHVDPLPVGTCLTRESGALARPSGKCAPEHCDSGKNGDDQQQRNAQHRQSVPVTNPLIRAKQGLGAHRQDGAVRPLERRRGLSAGIGRSLSVRPALIFPSIEIHPLARARTRLYERGQCSPPPVWGSRKRRATNWSFFQTSTMSDFESSNRARRNAAASSSKGSKAVRWVRPPASSIQIE